MNTPNQRLVDAHKPFKKSRYPQWKIDLYRAGQAERQEVSSAIRREERRAERAEGW